MEGINGPLNGGIKMVTLPLRRAPLPPTVQNPTHLGIEAALGGYFLLSLSGMKSDLYGPQGTALNVRWISKLNPGGLGGSGKRPQCHLLE